jgi:O-antigen/teichoic acid export membrane protein
MSHARQIFSNTLVQVGGRAVGTVLALLTVSLMTRRLGPDGYGQFTTAISFLQFFGILVDFGLTMTMAKMLAAAGHDEDRVASNIMTMRLVSGLFFFSLSPLVALAFPYSDAVRAAIEIGAVSFLAMSLSAVLGGVFQRHLATKHVAIAEVAGRIVLLAGTWLVVRSPSLTDSLALGLMMTALAISNLVQLAFLVRAAGRFVRLHPAFDFALWHDIVSESWPIAISIAFNLIYLKGDVVIMSVFRPIAEVGLYGAAYKVLDVVTVVPTVFMGLILPIVAADWAAGRTAAARQKIAGAFDALALFAVPLFVGTLAVSRDLMVLVTDERFADSGRYLSMLMLAAAAVCLGSAFTYSAVSLGLQKKVFWLYGLDALISVGLYFALIPRYGGDAAAWVTVFSEVFISVACAIAVTRVTRAWPSLRVFGLATVSAALMYAALLLIPDWHVLLRIAVGAAVYAGAAIAVGAVKRATVLDFLRKS